MSLNAPWGTMDTLPEEMRMRRMVEYIFMEKCRIFGYNEIHTPVFEQSSLFRMGVGHVTDIVEKELYTFSDKHGERLALRPEGTTGVARAVLQHKLYEKLPEKLCYKITCYRQEDPEEGRLREFHQIGAECYGSSGPEADSEIIDLAYISLKAMGISKLTLNINSVGCEKCRIGYLNELMRYLLPYANSGRLCPVCMSRLGKNPLRILDCKNPMCKETASHAPSPMDFLCENCREHFAGLQEQLNAIDIPFTVKPRLIRGLDYYNRTVFEFKAGAGGAKGTVCGGGRYDNLCRRIGADFSIPAVGFAIGEERAVIAMRSEGTEEFLRENPAVYVISESSALSAEAAAELRSRNIFTVRDLMGKTLREQEKEASACGAMWRIYVFEDKIRLCDSVGKERVFPAGSWDAAAETVKCANEACFEK